MNMMVSYKCLNIYLLGYFFEYFGLNQVHWPNAHQTCILDQDIGMRNYYENFTI